MSILEEILAKESRLIERAGFGERILYFFLTDKIGRQKIIIPSGEIDKVCYAAFVSRDLDVSKEINRELNATPVKGAHFSNNLISIIAFSKTSATAKNQYLQKYFDSHSLLDKFIIKECFEDFYLSEPQITQTSLEGLIKEVFIRKDYQSAEKFLLKSIEETGSLMELYAVRSSWEQLLAIHPNKEIEIKFSELSMMFRTLIEKVEKRIDQTVNCLVVLSGVVVGPLIIYLVKKYWDDWSLEPMITSGGIVIEISFVIFVILYNKSPENLPTRIKSLKRTLVKRWLNRNGLSMEKVEEVLNSVNYDLRSDNRDKFRGVIEK